MKNRFSYLLFTLLIPIILVPTARAQLPSTASAQKPGSVLFYNIYTSKVDDPGQQNTRLSLTNLAPDSVIVHWFFVDSDSCTVADAFTCLTAHQTLSFLSSDYDPGVTGYVVAVAVDPFGNPRDFDYLIGSEYVKFASGHQARLTAEVAGVVKHPLVYYPVPGSGGTQVDLAFDDASYERLPFGLALNNLSSSKDNNETMLIINRIGGDLGDKLSNIGMLNGLLYNDAEKSFSFTLRTNGCQLRGILNDIFPRTVPSYSKVIGSGKSGWMRLFTAETVDNTPLGGANDARAMLGVMINFNADSQVSGAAFNQGHNLHRLSKAPFTRLRIPVIMPPGC